MATETVWIITNGPARGGTHVTFRSAEAAQDACEGFTAEFGYPIVEDWTDLSAAKTGETLARYYEFNAGAFFETSASLLAVAVPLTSGTHPASTFSVCSASAISSATALGGSFHGP